MSTSVKQSAATAVHNVAVSIIDGNLLTLVFRFLHVAHVGQAQLVDWLIVANLQHLLHLALYLVGINQFVYQLVSHIVLRVGEGNHIIGILVQHLHTNLAAFRYTF